MRIAFWGIALILLGCTGIPEGLQAVDGFDAGRYLGKWYEIARLDHAFERGLTNVTAEYSRGSGDEIEVVNRGFDVRKGQWREIRGVARPSGEQHVGSLEVSFFGPFWGGYHIIALDRENYGYAVVTGPNRSYLWILSREKTLDEQVLAGLISRARAWGFETERLIFVEHGMPVMDVPDVKNP
ncbi:MAG TPA: lipocalin family protein [Syntrophales bacterium]|nr:lipocalin family protein [Syntrophales bacterium]